MPGVSRILPGRMPGPGRRGRPASLLGRAVTLAAVLLLVGLVLRVANAWTDLDALSRTTIPDDSFYYFSIARHLARGGPPSLDGVSPTNGYHPLWMVLLVPLYRFVPWSGDGVRAPVHAALTFGAVLDVAAAYLFWRILGTLRVRSLPRLLALAVFVLNPFGIALATSGLETPLALFFALLLFWIYLEGESPRAPSWKRAAITFGVIGGLMTLARTDHGIVLGVLLAVRVWRWHRGSRAPPSGGYKRWAATAALAAGLVVLPWPIYSYATTGAVVQSSSLAIAVVVDRMPEVWGFSPQPLWLRIERLASSVGEASYQTFRLSGIGLLPFSMAGAAGLAICAMATARAKRLFGAQLSRALPLVLAFGTLFVLHTLVRKVFREWYTPPLVATLLVLFALVFDALLRSAKRPRVAFAAAAVLVAACLVVEWRTWRSEGLFALADYRNIGTEPGLNEGHTDCGAVAYFTDEKITNLDGVVNQGALEALRRGRLIEYLRGQDFRRFYASHQLQSHVFFGRRYREQLRGDEEDHRAQRVVKDDAEKDRLIRLAHEPMKVGDPRGRELLGDGWEWPEEPEPGRLVESIGPASELVFIARSTGAAEPKIEVELLASEVDENGVQRVDALLNGALAASFDVRPELGWHSIPAKNLEPGRNRLRFEYRSPRADRRPGGHGEWWHWWRWMGGNALRAVEMRGVRFLTGVEARLPPEGPSLAEPAADAVLETGWLGVERDGPGPAAVWAVASSAEVAFFSSLPAGDHQLVLEIGPPPPDGERVDQTVVVLLNGKRLGKLELAAGDVATHKLRVPDGTLTNAKNRLVLEFGRLSPRDEAGVERGAYVRRIALE
jgi:hypothetical protein